jgi:hypothetical protein
MNHDLDAEMRDLAEQAAAGHRLRRESGAGVSTADVTRRVRRHRRVRAALTTGAGLVVVSGLVLGATALTQRHDPQPASTPAPTAPSPTVTATPSAVVLPTGDPALAYGACGSLTGTATDRSDDYTLALTSGETTVPAGTALTVDVERYRADASTPYVAVVERAATHVAVSLDGVVVATAVIGSTDLLVDTDWEGAGTADVVATDGVSLVTCAVDGQADLVPGLPLPAGTYQVQAWSPVQDLGTGDTSWAFGTDGSARPAADLVAERGSARTVLAEPVTVTITGTAEAADPLPGAGQPVTQLPASAWPECGGAAPEPSTSSTYLLTTGAAGTTVQQADLAAVSAELEYTGPGRLELTDRGTFAWLVQDGVVVGSDLFALDGGLRRYLGSGQPILRQASADLLSPCVDGGLQQLGDLPSGEYQVYLAAFLDVVEIQPGDGPAVPGDSAGGPFVVAEPFTLVVP